MSQDTIRFLEAVENCDMEDQVFELMVAKWLQMFLPNVNHLNIGHVKYLDHLSAK